MKSCTVNVATHGVCDLLLSDLLPSFNECVPFIYVAALVVVAKTLLINTPIVVWFSVRRQMQDAELHGHTMISETYGEPTFVSMMPRSLVRELRSQD